MLNELFAMCYISNDFSVKFDLLNFLYIIGYIVKIFMIYIEPIFCNDILHETHN